MPIACRAVTINRLHVNKIIYGAGGCKFFLAHPVFRLPGIDRPLAPKEARVQGKPRNHERLRLKQGVFCEESGQFLVRGGAQAGYRYVRVKLFILGRESGLGGQAPLYMLLEADQPVAAGYPAP